MAATDKQKQSLYFSEETLREIGAEAIRLDRSLSWTVQQAWRIARDSVRKFPSAHGRDATGRNTAASSPRERPAASGAHGDSQAEPSDQVREFLKGKFDREMIG